MIEHSDPREHIIFYHSDIYTFKIFEDKWEAMLCKIFSTSLTGSTLSGSDGLEKGSITFFNKFIKVS